MLNTPPWRHNPTRAGASAYGSHFWSQWDSGPYQWFMAKRAPHPSGGTGLRPHGTDRNLLVGLLFHDAAHRYYEAGFADGQYAVDPAVDRAAENARPQLDQWPDDITFEADIALVRAMLRRYDEATGPNSPVPDFPRLRIAVDANGLPILEREFTMPLPGGGVYTVRIDGLVEYAGSLYVLEHKTSASQYWATAMRSSLHMSLQTAGHCMGDCRGDGSVTIDELIAASTSHWAPCQSACVLRSIRTTTAS